MIVEILKKKPKDLEAFLNLLREEGYEIKRGKHIAVKGRAQKRFIRRDSLHEGFRTQDLMHILAKAQETHSVQQTSGKRQKIDLLIDLLAKAQEGKGARYQHWAKVFNLKQIAKVLLFLQENDIHDYEQLDQMAKEAAVQTDHLLSDIKQKEARMQEIKELWTHIINYSKTRGTYTAYRKAGYSQKFFEAHREKITFHKAAKKAFDHLKLKKIPKVAELNEKFNCLAKEKNAKYAQYRTERERMWNRVNARRNAEMIMNEKNQENARDSRK